MPEPWSVPRLWPGATVVIIAGGPSLTLRQVHHVARAKLEGRCHVIVVNDACYVAWWADWLHGCDQKWWLRHAQTATRFSGIKTTLDTGIPRRWDIYRLDNLDSADKTYSGGFDPNPTGLRTGKNGAYQAIGIAVHAGASRVLLLGVDMRSDGPTHWHAGHPEGWGRTNHAVATLPWFATLVEPLAELGVEVVNCAPSSALTCWPMGDIEQLL